MPNKTSSIIAVTLNIRVNHIRPYTADFHCVLPVRQSEILTNTFILLAKRVAVSFEIGG
jgi:hypothetical protein